MIGLKAANENDSFYDLIAKIFSVRRQLHSEKTMHRRELTLSLSSSFMQLQRENNTGLIQKKEELWGSRLSSFQ